VTYFPLGHGGRCQLVWVTLPPWRRRQHVPPKRQRTSNGTHIHRYVNLKTLRNYKRDSHCGGVGPRPGHVSYLVDKVALGQVSEYFGFPRQFSHHHQSSTHTRYIVSILTTSLNNTWGTARSKTNMTLGRCWFQSHSTHVCMYISVFLLYCVVLCRQSEEALWWFNPPNHGVTNGSYGSISRVNSVSDRPEAWSVKNRNTITMMHDLFRANWYISTSISIIPFLRDNHLIHIRFMI
jgi:hypothetical protein